MTVATVSHVRSDIRSTQSDHRGQQPTLPEVGLRDRCGGPYTVYLPGRIRESAPSVPVTQRAGTRNIDHLDENVDGAWLSLDDTDIAPLDAAARAS